MNLINKPTFGLEQKWQDQFKDFFRKYPGLERVSIFGSRARGTQKEFSDIDFCIYGNNLNELDAQKIKEGLEELFHPYKIDVLAFDSISDVGLKQVIRNEEKLFFCV